MADSGESDLRNKNNNHRKTLDDACQYLNKELDRIIADAEKKFGVKIPIKSRQYFGIKETIELEVRDKFTNKLKDKRIVETK